MFINPSCSHSSPLIYRFLVVQSVWNRLPCWILVDEHFQFSLNIWVLSLQHFLVFVLRDSRYSLFKTTDSDHCNRQKFGHYLVMPFGLLARLVDITIYWDVWPVELRFPYCGCSDICTEKVSDLRWYEDIIVDSKRRVCDITFAEVRLSPLPVITHWLRNSWYDATIVPNHSTWY